TAWHPPEWHAGLTGWDPCHMPEMMEGRSHLATEVRSLPSLSETLARVRRRERLERPDAIRLLDADDREIDSICEHAAELRDEAKGHVVTYSPKLFLPVTNLCRDRCRYCTFRKDPWDDGAWTMTEEEVRSWTRRGATLGCREALMCLGDRPEAAFRQYRALLALLGHE